MNDQVSKIIISISKRIQVSISSRWIFTEGSPWVKDSSVFISKYRQRNRLRTIEQKQLHYFYRLRFSKLSNGTNAMLFNIPIIYTGLYDFSNILCEKEK